MLNFQKASSAKKVPRDKVYHNSFFMSDIKIKCMLVCMLEILPYKYQMIFSFNNSLMGIYKIADLWKQFERSCKKKIKKKIHSNKLRLEKENITTLSCPGNVQNR